MALAHPLSDDQASAFLRRMWEIRAFEEATQRLFTSGLVRGSTHLCQGQEAVVVGACGALSDGDSMLCTYRGHGAVLAMGAPADRAFGEIMGKADDGWCAALDREHMRCGIYERRPLVCREFEMGGDDCQAERAAWRHAAAELR